MLSPLPTVLLAAAVAAALVCSTCEGYRTHGRFTPSPVLSVRDDGFVSPNRQTNNILPTLLEAVSSLRSRLRQLEDTLADNRSSDGGGSVYVRWGNAKCPKSAELVYKGVMSGSYYYTHGGAANILCLSLTPTFTSDIKPPQPGTAKLYGMEYETKPNPANDQDGVCSVCRIAQGSTVMIPATSVCPEGWTSQYSGYLMAGKPGSGWVSTEYICVDKGMEGVLGGGKDTNQGRVYFAQYVCHGLPCPPFRKNEIATCAVCSK